MFSATLGTGVLQERPLRAHSVTVKWAWLTSPEPPVLIHSKDFLPLVQRSRGHPSFSSSGFNDNNKLKLHFSFFSPSPQFPQQQKAGAGPAHSEELIWPDEVKLGHWVKSWQPSQQSRSELFHPTRCVM